MEVSSSTLRWLFDLLNKALFSGALPECRVEYAEPSLEALRELEATRLFGWYDSQDGGRICLTSTAVEYDKLVDTMAHEMVHHWQATYGQPLDHQGAFPLWRSILRRDGITI